MRKIVIVTVLSIVVLSIGLFSFIKLNPPLVSGTVVTSEDNHVVVVDIGNKGFSNVKIKDVLINNNEQPLMRKMQVSNHLKGLLITDTLNSEASEYGMSEIEDVSILPDTSPTAQSEKANNGNATKNDKIYGLSIVHNKPIESIKIIYRYLGLSFEETVVTNDF